MLSMLRKLMGRAEKAAAIEAQENAQQSLELAQARTAEIRQLVERIDRHAVINHIGERVEAAWRGN